MGTEGTDYDLDIEALLREQHNPAAAERELNIYRSGSAPPTVEGSRAAAAGLFSPHARAAATEEEVRSHPAYLSYYYSNENLNPRLPPPTLTREDWRAAQRLRQPIGRKEAGEGGRGGSSLFSVQPGLTARDERELMELERLQRQNSSRTVDWGADGLGGMVDPRLGPRRKSFADTLKEDYGRPAPIPGHLSRPVSRNAFDNIVDPTRMSDVQLAKLHNDMENVDNSYSGATSNGLARAQSFGSTKSRSFASALGTSMARSTTPDPQLIRRSPSPSILAVGGRISDADKKIISNGFANVSSGMTNSDDIANTLSVLKLSENMTEDGQNFRHVQSQQNFVDHPELLYNMSRDQSQYMQQNKVQTQPSGSTIPLRAYNDFPQRTGTLKDVGLSSSNGQLNIPKRLPPNDVYRKVSPGSTSLARASDHLQTDRTSIDFAGCDPNTYSANLGMPSSMNKQPDQVGAEGQYFNRNHVGTGYQLPITDPLYAQYLQRTSDSVPQGHGLLNDPSLGRNYSATSLMDMPGYQEAYIGALLAQQNMHYGSPFLGKSSSFNNGLYEDPNFGLGMPYPSHLPGSPFSSFGPASPLRQNDRLSSIPSIPRGAVGGSKGSWNYENRITDGGFASSLLEELKNNKTRSFELTEIVGHVLEFSGDQYGSRFIQQKLETGSVEEKNSIFPEILPHARILMTDVFGNYVIQKFFEHGTQSQRNQLADQLIGHVLPLSLQMYGCRVIQKALEVVDVNQQTLMVAELDGSIMKCVRDQNGNHVIQKCIECVPQERIQFIISSFYEQVVALSTHPYGCRVIQRVLEHCDDAQTQSKMMEEILQSVCTLAQDQYGNYVVQHVLQHGKQEERSAIVSKLAGQIVKMSQQKFASNVVEKCLTYGTPEERKLLIDEILAITEENDSLQAMMKDQFGNYVVQKVLETCDDQKLELIISRIKAHLNALKKYTYGKHIVARVEKLIATGERRIGMSANSA